MDSTLIYAILDIIATMQEAVKQMTVCYQEDNLEEFYSLSIDLRNGLSAVQEIAECEIGDDACSRLRKACVCAAASVKDIRQMALHKTRETTWKLECELLMILENMRLEFYYRELVYGHPERQEEFQKQIKKIGYFHRMDQPEEEREYACDLSIQVLAYNHLDVTKSCVENILMNMPTGISCELILYNHGSDDGTREYFESIEGAHVVNVAVNRAFIDLSMRYIRGKYLLFVSNDVIVGESAIENMYRAMVRRDDYGWIVPSTPNVSNRQTIPVDYDSLPGFLAFAERNNIYDEKRHEMRVRLCNPIHLIRMDIYGQYILDTYKWIYRICESPLFPDDRLSLWMRRHKYKNILAKDAYCHHMGSITLKNDFDSEEKWLKFYNGGREVFQNDFGVDPWGTGSCYDSGLFLSWRLPKIDRASVLGINCGLGSNSLKVRELLKEQGMEAGVLYNATQEGCYLSDLQGTSDEAFQFESLREIARKAGRSRFDFIVIDDALKGCRSEDYPKKLNQAGLKFGELAFRDERGSWHIVEGE